MLIIIITTNRLAIFLSISNILRTLSMTFTSDQDPLCDHVAKVFIRYSTTPHRKYVYFRPSDLCHGCAAIVVVGVAAAALPAQINKLLLFCCESK